MCEGSLPIPARLTNIQGQAGGGVRAQAGRQAGCHVDAGGGVRSRLPAYGAQ